MLGEARVFELLHRVLQLSPAGQTEALFVGFEEGLTRFANNEIHQHVAETHHALILRVAIGKRVAALSTTRLDDAGLTAALEQALTLARLQPENPDFPGFTPPTPMPADVPVAYDETTAQTTPQQRAQAVGDVLRYAQAHGVVASGALMTGCYEWGLATSLGHAAYLPTTLSDLTIVAMTETGSGYAADAAWRVADIDVAARGREAIDKAIRAQNPRPLEPGEYPVVLDTYAAQDLLNFLGGAASAQSVHEGQSWMSGRQGQALLSEKITIVDDPLDPELWPLPFDFEGMPRRRVAIVERGVVGEAVYDRLWAAKTGHVSTGHALPAFSPFNPAQVLGGMGPAPLHLTMRAGDTPIEEMIRKLDRGLYITRFNYTRPVHPREVVVTGLTRDGTFWIENGEIAYPVQNLRFTQSYVAALKEVIAVGDAAQRERGYAAITRAPALCLPSFRFTGTTGF